MKGEKSNVLLAWDYNTVNAFEQREGGVLLVNETTTTLDRAHCRDDHGQAWSRADTG